VQTIFARNTDFSGVDELPFAQLKGNSANHKEALTLLFPGAFKEGCDAKASHPRVNMKRVRALRRWLRCARRTYGLHHYDLHCDRCVYCGRSWLAEPNAPSGAGSMQRFVKLLAPMLPTTSAPGLFQTRKVQ